eukprot:scaffold277482_cov18-Tisochrysis_lutea.AAC.1
MEARNTNEDKKDGYVGTFWRGGLRTAITCNTNTMTATIATSSAIEKTRIGGTLRPPASRRDGSSCTRTDLPPLHPPLGHQEDKGLRGCNL